MITGLLNHLVLSSCFVVGDPEAQRGKCLFSKSNLEPVAQLGLGNTSLNSGKQVGKANLSMGCFFEKKNTI